MPEEKCPNCETPYEPDATFCINCGAKREEAAESEPPAPSEAVAPAEPPAKAEPPKEEPPPRDEPPDVKTAAPRGIRVRYGCFRTP